MRLFNQRIYVAVLVAALSPFIATAQQSEVIASADDYAGGDDVAPSVREFLTAAADLRRRSLSDQQDALKSSDTESIRKFATRRLLDDERAIHQINVLASKLNVSLYRGKDAGALTAVPADQFDVAYCQRVSSRLEKELEVFRLGAECDDRWVRAFAAEYMPVIENQLIVMRSISQTSR